MCRVIVLHLFSIKLPFKGGIAIPLLHQQFKTMGCVSSQEENVEVPIDDIPHTNVHNTIPDLKVHTVITNELDFDHTVAMSIPLGGVIFNF